MASVNKIEQTTPTDTSRVAAENLEAVAAPAPVSEVRYPSGLAVFGSLFRTRQDHILRVLPGTSVSWQYGVAELGLAGDRRIPIGQMPFHTAIPSLSSPYTMSDGQKIMIHRPFPPVDKNDPRYIEETIIVECSANERTFPPLHTGWPSVITGFVDADVADFLDETDGWIETSAGWTGRYGHPWRQMPSTGEPGYGGALALVTSFGAMLLCSTLNVDLKAKVQDRFVEMGDYLEFFNIDYPANGGHGNGRYIIWLIKQAARGNPTSVLNASMFSENQQIYDTGGGVPGWRFYNSSASGNPVYEYCCTINRWMGAAVCAKLATFLGANTSLWVQYTTSYMTANNGISPAWYFSMSSKLATIFMANRVAIGF